ncbi:hypothetical protein BGX21_005160 [Mortierella sp. AD011]|nr:hypothetical protein BGX20_009162 [Mortierella sp. AD010]KAF9400026.1 hypothetical protein BGX21_005160 [Mortierella sp. AD011]
MEVLKGKKVKVLEVSPACTYKTCRKTNPTRQHSNRRHSSTPYLRRVNGKVARFTRSGEDGDEERPYQCCCGREYQNTRSLADHLSNGCGSFQVAIQEESVSSLKSRDNEEKSKSPTNTQSFTLAENSSENCIIIGDKSEVFSQHDPALTAHVMDLEIRVQILERTIKQYEQVTKPNGGHSWCEDQNSNVPLADHQGGCCQTSNYSGGMPLPNAGWRCDGHGGGMQIPLVPPPPPQQLPQQQHQQYQAQRQHQHPQQQQQQQPHSAYGLPSLSVLYPNSNMVHYQSWRP